MNPNDLLPYIIIAGFIITIGSVFWKMSSVYSKIEQRFVSFQNAMKIVENSLKGNLHFQETILQVLSKAKFLTQEDYLQIINNYRTIHSHDITSTIDSLVQKSNPLTTDEINRLKIYKEKIAIGPKEFSQEDALDFQKLVHRAEEEYPDNTGIYILLGLAALILGLVLWSSSKNN